MYGGLGHFKALLQRRKQLKSKKIEKYGNKAIDVNELIEKTDYNFPKLDKAKIESLKTKIRTKSKKEALKNKLVFCLILCLLFCLIYYFIQ